MDKQEEVARYTLLGRLLVELGREARREGCDIQDVIMGGWQYTEKGTEVVTLLTALVKKKPPEPVGPEDDFTAALSHLRTLAEQHPNVVRRVAIDLDGGFIPDRQPSSAGRLIMNALAELLRTIEGLRK